MGEVLPNGEIGGYEGYCPKCHKIIKTNMQGNDIGNHACNTQNKQPMILEKQDVVYIPFDNFKYNDLVIADGNNHIIAGAKPIHNIYVLTETQLETLKNEYYAIGLREAELNKSR